MKHKFNNDDLKEMRNSITLLQGNFDVSFFKLLKERNPKKVYVLEGRPSLEASKTSSKELLKKGISPTILSDNMAGFLFYKNLIKEIWLAYLDINSKGALCHIGSSILCSLAIKHNVPVFCYPSSYINKKNKELLGKDKDITGFLGKQITSKKTKAYVPLFEWIPGKNFIVNNDNLIKSES